MSINFPFMVKELMGDDRFALLCHRDLARQGIEEYGKQFEALAGQRKNILVCCPDHDNIGDHAIAVAEMQLLSKQQDPFIACAGDGVKALACLKKYATPDDTIYLHGGGNMGTLYMREEGYRCDVISAMKRNKIVMFPQTMSYGDTELDKQLLKHSRRVYSSHRNLHLIARERVSYERMKEAYPDTDVRLTPDIVLSMSGNDTGDFSARHGVLLCLRNDVEQSLGKESSAALEKIAESVGEGYSYTDTTAGAEYIPVSLEQGERFVFDKFEEFRGARLVITDRLHGMIFSAVTGTPCIALNNANGKVGFEYEWLKHLPYIRFVERIDDVRSVLPDLLTIQGTWFPSEEFQPLFQPLLQLL